jgi:hypothetical protein
VRYRLSRSNQSIEPTAVGALRAPTASAHLHRWASQGSQLRTQLLLLGALVSACSPNEPAERTVELFVTPTAFAVDGVAVATAAEAADAAIKKAPAVLLVPTCGAMETKRVVDVMAGLQGKHNARVVMSVVGPGERGCPTYTLPQ